MALAFDFLPGISNEREVRKTEETITWILRAQKAYFALLCTCVNDPFCGPS